MNQAIQEVTESKPALSLDTEEGRTEQVDLLKRLEMGDYTYDFTDREVSFIETWPGENGHGAFSNPKIIEAYGLEIAESGGPEPVNDEYTWPLFAAFLRYAKEEWEATRPRGKREKAIVELSVALRECYEAGMDDDDIFEVIEQHIE